MKIFDQNENLVEYRDNDQNYSNRNIRNSDNTCYKDNNPILLDKFGINSNVFNLIHIPSNFNRNQCESHIQNLKEKLIQKRITVSMDPSNFELPEKNILQVQSLEEKYLVLRKIDKKFLKILKN